MSDDEVTGNDPGRAEVREALGQIGDAAMPPKSFDELSVSVGDAPAKAGVGGGSRWWLSPAWLAGAMVVVLAIGVAALMIDRGPAPEDTGGTQVVVSGPSEESPPPSDDTTPSTTIAAGEESNGPDLVGFAEEIGAATVIVQVDSSVYLAIDGEASTMSVPTGAIAWSDGAFVYYSEGAGDEAVSTVLTPDGVVVCEVDGRVDHATERADGSFVAAIEYDWPTASPEEGERREVPREAVDCATGERTPIESVFSVGVDGQFWFTETVGDRVFLGEGDAEGNADLFNESDVSINGEDYAGGHVFNADGSVVTYGDFGQSVGPHFTTVIRTRETTSGELLWSAELSSPFSFLSHFGDRVFVGLADPESLASGVPTTNEAVVFDANTGERLGDWPAPFRPLYVGGASPERVVTSATTMTLAHEPTDFVPAGERWSVRARGTCVVDGDVTAGAEASATGGSLEEPGEEAAPCASITVAVILGPGEGEVLSSTASEDLIYEAVMPPLDAGESFSYHLEYGNPDGTVVRLPAEGDFVTQGSP